MCSTDKNSILIIDDDTLSLTILTQILQPDYTVHTAKDGLEAIRMAERVLPDLILLDIILPGMDGYQVFTALRDSVKVRHIPIIFVTGLNNSEAEKRGLSMGAADYISKPYDETLVKLRVALHMRIIDQLRAIEYLSTTDELTGMPNRRALDARLEMEWFRSMREGHPLTVMIIDADFFKYYNDTYGHLQGDNALKQVANILRQSIKRAADFAARWGGEEFVVLLPNTEARHGLQVAEMIRKNMEVSTIPRISDGASTKVTVSIGVNSQVVTPDNQMADFISGADKALYVSKNGGRNRVSLFGDPDGLL